MWLQIQGQRGDFSLQFHLLWLERGAGRARGRRGSRRAQSAFAARHRRASAVPTPIERPSSTDRDIYIRYVQLLFLAKKSSLKIKRRFERGGTPTATTLRAVARSARNGHFCGRGCTMPPIFSRSGQGLGEVLVRRPTAGRGCRNCVTLLRGP